MVFRVVVSKKINVKIREIIKKMIKIKKSYLKGTLFYLN